MVLNEQTLSDLLQLNKLTKQQKQAITSKNTPILVSASAGSGKTLALCNRILFKILNPQNEISLQNLLVVSFTKTAAAEIFNRIVVKLNELINKCPNEPFFKKQLNLMSQNNITTIDSFCSNFLKENFELAQISPNFKIGTEIEFVQIKNEILNKILEQEEQKNSKKLNSLSDYFNLSSQTGLKNAILKIFEKSRTNPFPEQFLTNLTLNYKKLTPLELNTQYTDIIKQEILDRINQARTLILNALTFMDDPILKKNFEPIFQSTAINLKNLEEKIEIAKFNEILTTISSFSFETLPRHNKKTNNFDLTLANFIKTKFLNPAKKLINSIPQILINNKQFNNDREKQKPIVFYLIKLCFKFSHALNNKKKETNTLEFSDLILKTIKLLAKPEQTNKFKMTKLGEQTKTKFDEILIDEFQDINHTQKILFTILSNQNKNLFAVGDLKQSIYRFRQSDPKIFLEYRNKFAKENKTIINLQNNFRSHSEITNSVNFLFGQIMSKNFGGIDYTRKESLISKTKFPINENFLTEFHILNNNSYCYNLNKTQITITHVATQIKTLIDSKFKVLENGELISCQPKHFAILLRSDTKESNALCQELSELDIDFNLQGRNQFLKSYEISILISILKIIDNPLNDIAFCAVCLSSIFNFSTKDLSCIKLNSKKTSLFLAFSDNKTEKCQTVINWILKLRQKLNEISLSQLVQTICDDDNFYNMFTQSTKMNEQIKSNLNDFLNLINNMEQTKPELTLSNFLNLINTFSNFDLNINLNKQTNFTEKNAVNIMTIHKSKGLEFPIVFIPFCEKKFNEQDFKSPFIISNQLGIGLKHSNPKNLTRYNTLQFNCIAIDEKNKTKEEELRLLYVAMTRAKQKLILVSTDFEGKFKNLITPQNSVLPSSFCRNKNSFYDWLLAGFSRHKNAPFNNKKIEFKEEEFKCDIVIKNKFEKIYQIDNHIKQANNEKLDNTNSKTKFANLVNLKIKINELCTTPAKISVSELSKREKNIKLKSLSFSEKIDNSEIGTAMHCFLQHINFFKAKQNLKHEIQTLVDNKFISEKQSKYLNLNQLKNFFNSNLFELIKNANHIERERNFIVEMDLNQHETKILKKPKTIVQGTVDLILEQNNKLTIVDYKTDRTTTENLILNYKKQIYLYKQAIEKLTKKHVVRCLIYSFYLNKIIEL